MWNIFKLDSFLESIELLPATFVDVHLSIHDISTIHIRALGSSHYWSILFIVLVGNQVSVLWAKNKTDYVIRSKLFFSERTPTFELALFLNPHTFPLF